MQPPPIPETLSFEGHALERIAERGISFAQAEQFAKQAKFAIRQRNGAQHVYYSAQGFIAIRSGGEISTVGWLDEAGKKIVEVMKNYGF